MESCTEMCTRFSGNNNNQINRELKILCSLCVHVSLTLKLAFLPFVSVDLIQMLEFNLTVSLPAASLLTVVLALVGKFHNVSFRYPFLNTRINIFCSLVFVMFHGK